MIETYAFLSVFLVQILVVSVLKPEWMIRYARAKAVVQLPGWSSEAIERFFGLFRIANCVIAALGLLLWCWDYNHLQNPDWTLAPVGLSQAIFCVLQYLP